MVTYGDSGGEPPRKPSWRDGWIWPGPVGWAFVVVVTAIFVLYAVNFFTNA